MSSKRDFLKMVGAGAMGAAGVAAAHAVGTSKTELRNAKDRVERILDEGKIRGGYSQYAPYFVRDPNNGQFSGLTFEVIEAVLHNLGLGTEWTEEVSFGAAATGLNANRYDIYGTQYWASGPRLRQGDFTLPFSFTPVYAYVSARKKDALTAMAGVNNPAITVATIDGEINSFIAADLFPQAKTLAAPQNSDIGVLMENLATGKADVTFVESLVANDFMTKSPGTISLLSPQPLQVFANSFLTSYDTPKLRRMIDGSLQELINKGKLEQILARHGDIGTGLLRVAKPYQQA